MDARFTPGPWTLKQFGGPQISGPDGYAVATMWGALSVSELRGQDRANARLIAAAPDMLEALQEVVAKFDAAPDAVKYTPLGINKCRAAISKALNHEA